jgi:beta-glucanase (GH16 family)
MIKSPFLLITLTALIICLTGWIKFYSDEGFDSGSGLLYSGKFFHFPESPQEWNLVWADEFNYQGLPDTTKWTYDVGGHGWGNKELQFYTRDRTQNARVEKGRLIIEARREAWEGNEYTSARLVSKGKGDWVYGRFEVKAKLPSGRGTWPAIWMLASGKNYGETFWPDNGEIDIMEHVGFNPDSVFASVHCKAYYHSIGTQKTKGTRVTSAHTSDHIYAVEWSPERIDAFFDGRKYFSFANDGKKDYRTWPFDQPFHLLLNIAVGGGWGGQKGIDANIWPQRMEVDYVRVYQRK